MLVIELEATIHLDESLIFQVDIKGVSKCESGLQECERIDITIR